MSPANWKKEVWTKSSQKEDVTRQLQPALQKVIEKKGSYLGFTSRVLVKTNTKEDRLNAIKTGIQEAGGDIDSITKIDIYDANKIADWASKYPAIVTWLKEKKGGLSLRGFQTIDELSQKSEFNSIDWVEGEKARFFIGTENDFESKSSLKENSLNFLAVKQRIFEHLSSKKGCFVQVLGASGLGKTRFVYELFKQADSNLDKAFASNTIYCDLSNIREEKLLQTLNDLVREKKVNFSNY